MEKWGGGRERDAILQVNKMFKNSSFIKLMCIDFFKKIFWQ